MAQLVPDPFTPALAAARVTTEKGKPTALPSVGLPARLKLTEPVRLYCYPLLVLLVVGGVAGGLVTQDWADWALPILGGLLSAGPVEAARASVYSPRSVVQAVRRAASQ